MEETVLKKVRGWLPVLLVVVMLVAAFTSGAFVLPQVTRLNFALAGQNISVTVREHWAFFDANGNPLASSQGTDSYSDQLRLTFESLRDPYPTVQGKVGWIIVLAEVTLENDMPVVNALGKNEVHFLTVDISGTLFVNGVVRANPQLVQYETDTNWAKLWAGWSHAPAAAFKSGDKAGKTEHGSFWILATPSAYLATCGNYPAACVDLSKDVGLTSGNFKLAVDFHESWKGWSSEAPSPLDVFFNWNGCAYKWYTDLDPQHLLPICTQLDVPEITATPHWEANISEFVSCVGTSCTVTKSSTVAYTVTVSQTLTVVSGTTLWIVVVKHSDTTTTGTGTVQNLEGAGSGCSTKLSPFGLGWLCSYLTWQWNGIPGWLIILGIALLLVYFYAPAPKRGSGVVNIILGGGRRSEDEFTV